MTADASRLIAALDRWGGAVQRQAAQTTPALMRATGDVPRESGELVGSIRSSSVSSGGGSWRFTVQAPVIQAATTDKGARPHPIVPRRAGGLLVFNWPRAGGTVFLRRVNHPGNPPKPWWERTVERAWQQALRVAARSVPFS